MRHLTGAALALALLLLPSPVASQQQGVPAYVTRVIDADTFYASVGNKISLALRSRWKDSVRAASVATSSAASWRSGSSSAVRRRTRPTGVAPTGFAVTGEAELHVLGREPEALSQLELVHESVRALFHDSAKHGAMLLPGSGLISASCRA